jgi:hypothetical protein
MNPHRRIKVMNTNADKKGCFSGLWHIGRYISPYLSTLTVSVLKYSVPSNSSYSEADSTL